MHVTGRTRVPGDKSLTHRALYLAALARGESRIEGALTSLDARSTARILRQLGVWVSPLGVKRVVRVRGGAWHAPNAPLNCGNSGTTARLGLGLLAARRFRSTLTGDRSLRRRPMRRVTSFLEQMGAKISFAEGDGLPLTISGGSLRPITAELPVSSAQLKGALLFAGVAGGVPVRIREPNGRSRDHTERMLRACGYTVTDEADGWIGFEPSGRITGFDFLIPGDISSAAFLIGTAVLADAGELTIEQVGVNPTRDGMLRVLERMGAAVQRLNLRDIMGEPVADLVIRPASLRATDIAAAEVPGLIDEIPMLAVLAARADGTSRFRQVGELRVKESDRLTLIARNIEATGGTAFVDGEDLVVQGSDHPPKGRVITEGDHRIAMAFSVLGTIAGAAVRVDDPACAAVSFPGFRETLRRIVRK
jgi:3-phosphoshikimate 1-carboxyvinyltransferase